MPVSAVLGSPVAVTSPSTPSAMRRATPLFIAGTSGATVVTWLIGFLSDRTGSLHSGMLVLVVSIALLVGLQILLAAKGAGDPARAVRG